MTRLPTVSAPEALASQLRARILAGELAAGAAVREEEMATLYGVGRPTVRAALQTLVSEGLLRRERNRSARVPQLVAEDIRDLFRARAAIEVDLVRRLAASGRVEALDESMAQLRAVVDGDWSAAVEADLAFHRALVASADSPRLARLYGLLEPEIRLCLAQLRPAYDSVDEVVTEHEAIVVAVRDGASDWACRILARHLHEAERVLVDAVIGDERKETL